MNILWILGSILYLSISLPLFGQSVVDDVEEANSSTLEVVGAELFNEKILRMSADRKVLILSNSNDNLHPGDYYSILLGNQLVTRGIVAKEVKEKTLLGTKLYKIYSLSRFDLLKSGMTVQVIKGDDSYFKLKKKEKEEEKLANELESGPKDRIMNEDDLFNDETLLSDGAELDERSNRLIKTDNILGGGWGQLSANNGRGESAAFYQWSLNWAYQLADNFWGEAVYATSTMSDFPNGGVTTSVTSLVFRLKYAIQAPFDAYIFPYVGYESTQADCPGAGEKGDSDLKDEELQAELDAVNNINNNGIILGFSLLKRLAPGWFAKADVGMDMLSIGVALEF